jgi:glycerol-3-phosphate acyltransferase PlsY
VPELAVALVAAYLLGGIPFAFLVVRVLRGVDVRHHGSGNVGATNAARCFEGRVRIAVFLLIFVLDSGKGFLATALPGLIENVAYASAAPVLCGLAAVLGHSFTPYLRFRGGKGVATSVGVLIGLEPVATSTALVVFFALYGATRIVAVGSLGMAVALPVAVGIHGTAPPAVFWLAVALGMLIVVRHRTNIVRLLRRNPT